MCDASQGCCGSPATHTIKSAQKGDKGRSVLRWNIKNINKLKITEEHRLRGEKHSSWRRFKYYYFYFCLSRKVPLIYMSSLTGVFCGEGSWD